MKLKLTLIILTGLILLSIHPVKAQSDTSKITAAHLAVAEQLIKSTGMTDVRFSLMRSELIKSLSTTIPIPDKNKGKFVVGMTAFMDKYLPLDLFKSRFVKLYAEAFTEDELRQLIDFYKSPIGKKIISKVPELLQNGMLMEQQALKDHYSEIESIASDSMKE